jgi:predicted nucleic acid-binding protein
VILADTSVWVNHFRHGDTGLVNLLENGRVLIHPLIIGELACGNLPRRAETLDLLRRLPQVSMASGEEVFQVLEAHRLWGKGLGWIDVALLASAILAGSLLWTYDRRLATVAHRAGVSHPARH